MYSIVQLPLNCPAKVHTHGARAGRVSSYVRARTGRTRLSRFSRTLNKDLPTKRRAWCCCLVCGTLFVYRRGDMIFILVCWGLILSSCCRLVSWMVATISGWKRTFYTGDRSSNPSFKKYLHGQDSNSLDGVLLDWGSTATSLVDKWQCVTTLIKNNQLPCRRTTVYSTPSGGFFRRDMARRGAVIYKTVRWDIARVKIYW